MFLHCARNLIYSPEVDLLWVRACLHCFLVLYNIVSGSGEHVVFTMIEIHHGVMRMQLTIPRPTRFGRVAEFGSTFFFTHVATSWISLEGSNQPPLQGYNPFTSCCPVGRFRFPSPIPMKQPSLLMFEG